MNTTIEKDQITQVTEQFLTDVVQGLMSYPKKLQSKYFYDKEGDKIFQEIMALPEYYLTNCEMEILELQSKDILATILSENNAIDLIELGAGDATKSINLLKKLTERNTDYNYLPIDISANVIRHLEEQLPNQLPHLKIKGFTGDYFDMLEKAVQYSDNAKVVLFMGANIGNMLPEEANCFLTQLRSHLQPNDVIIVGFDLKKNPREILAAYNDDAGTTSRFNLNLLNRINLDLGANFVVENFEHYANYDPKTGACKSYLISLEDQIVNIDGNEIQFEKNEFIDMEISQKYADIEIDELMASVGFEYIKNFYDKRHYFVDSIWRVA